MNFATTLDEFDRDFPGHYRRQLRRVRGSVVALVPPSEGIKASLTTSGVSRMITGDEVFRPVLLRRPPETISLTSPQDATGVLDLRPEVDAEMRFLFEGMGVATDWQLDLPWPANNIDPNSLADVYVTYEFTAETSPDLRQQVLSEGSDRQSTERAFRFRDEFSDQWFDLNNPEQTAEPMTVRFRTDEEDFPVNLRDLRIQNVLLYFVGGDGDLTELETDAQLVPEWNQVELRFQERGSNGIVGGRAPPMEGVVSGRRSQRTAWSTSVHGKRPAGEWTLSLPNTSTVRNLFVDDVVDDILFVVTVDGRLPEWPDSSLGGR